MNDAEPTKKDPSEETTHDLVTMFPPPNELDVDLPFHASRSVPIRSYLLVACVICLFVVFLGGILWTLYELSVKEFDASSPTEEYYTYDTTMHAHYYFWG